MRKTPSPDSDAKILAVAMLRARGRTEKSAGKTLGISQSQAHRLQGEAVHRRWFNLNPSVLYRNVPPELVHEAIALLAPTQLEKQLKKVLFPGHLCGVSIVRERLLRNFGIGACAAVLPHLCDARLLGVSWGRSVAAIVDGLEFTLHESPRQADSPAVQPVPVCGDPIGVAEGVQEFSSSGLAARLERLLNHEHARANVPSLSAVCAYLPRNLGKAGGGMRQFLARSPGYRAVTGAGTDEGLFGRIDTLLTGIGVPEYVDGHSQGVFVVERAMCEEIGEDELRRLVYGDIAGVLIPRPGLSKKDGELVERLNEGWTGLRLGQIERCAREANERGRGGVIVVTNRRIKREFVLELLRRGLVNRLVLDAELADALMDEATAPTEGGPRPEGARHA